MGCCNMQQPFCCQRGQPVRISIEDEGVETMERNRKRPGLLEKTAEMLDLPGDVVAGLPKLELTGSRELRMENHKGILAYGSEEIHISGGKWMIKVRGQGLELKAMTGSQLLITGEIAGIDLE